MPNLETLMKNLQISRDEALELVEFDKQVDKVRKTSELNNDLTTAQKQAVKQMSKAPTVYRFDTSKREYKKDETKTLIMNEIFKLLSDNEIIGASDVKIANAGKLITFSVGSDNFKLDLIKSRK